MLKHNDLMKIGSKTFRRGVLVVLTCLCLLDSTEAKTRRRRRPARSPWEYNVVSILHANTEQRRTILNNEGRMGWELMFVSEDQNNPGTTNFYFKRLKRRR